MGNFDDYIKTLEEGIKDLSVKTLKGFKEEALEDGKAFWKKSEDDLNKLGQEFTDMNGAKHILNDQYLKKAAADLVKNNVPNYVFVSDFIKGLRQLPVVNFVAFP